MAIMMAADDEDNEVDGDGVTGDGATGSGAMGNGATTVTMAMGNNDDDDGDGATGNKVDNDGDGATGDDDEDDDDDGVTTTMTTMTSTTMTTTTTTTMMTTTTTTTTTMRKTTMTTTTTTDDDGDGATGYEACHVVAPIHNTNIIFSLLLRSGARIKNDVFQLWLKFSSYASPIHPRYVQDYCDVTGPGYGVTVIMVTVKKGSQ